VAAHDVPELERYARWLMTMRGVTVTTLLICAFAIELLLRPEELLAPLFRLAAVAYGMVLLYALLDRRLRGTASFLVLQLVGDALLVTGFVGITGGIDSPMSFLYLLPISVASMLLFRRAGVAFALLGWGLYAALAAWSLGWRPPSGPGILDALGTEPGRAAYVLTAHLVAMMAFALLSAHLGDRLRTQKRELVERQGAMVRLKELNENIIESINSGLLTTNLDGEVNFMNRGGAEILDRTQDEVAGGHVGTLFGLDREFLAALDERLLANRRFRFERYHDTPAGRRIFLGIAASNLHDRDGRPLGYIFIFQDLTEIHALEQEMRLKERMVALGEMAAGMAHELRNPLAAMSGAVQYLKGEIRPRGETLELMDIILRESHRLDQAIRDFLTFARPGRFAPETVDVVKLLEDNVKLLRKSHEFRDGHRIDTSYPAPRVDCRVDPNRLKQVFWNLATNALKAMPDGGCLRLAVSVAADGGTLCVEFTDEGQGMDAEERERYFQPFSSRFHEGTGLGAAIVYRLVAEHGGRVHLDSERGRGTRVRITLPRYGARGAGREAPRLSVAAGG
jgi:two-component system sensor histidine kinase PilS (NtrC family)